MLLFIYLVLGYWAVGRTILRDKIMFANSLTDLWGRRLMLGFALGWLCIPWAILGLLFGRKRY